MGEQSENLERVTQRIGNAILVFFAGKVQDKRLEFHAEDMRDYVTQTVGVVAPGSPDRVMRDLRKKGWLSYKVINRADSLYQIQNEG